MPEPIVIKRYLYGPQQEEVIDFICPAEGCCSGDDPLTFSWDRFGRYVASSEECAMRFDMPSPPKCNPGGCDLCKGKTPGACYEAVVGEEMRPICIPELEDADVSVTIKRRAISLRLRTAVMERDGFACQRCGSYVDLVIDHIWPVIRGGETELQNLQVLCYGCNAAKQADLPTLAEMLRTR